VAGKRHKPEEIVLKLRQAEVLKLQGASAVDAISRFCSARVAMIYSSVDINLRIVHLFRSRTLHSSGD
jgi:hypothetical protein